VIGTAGTAILRPHLFVSLEASIRECTVNSSLLECPVLLTSKIFSVCKDFS
jgi:hypothetical protein